MPDANELAGMDEEGLRRTLGELLASNKATQANLETIQQQFPIQPSNTADSIPSWEELEEGGLEPPNPEEGEGESFAEQLGVGSEGGGSSGIRRAVGGVVSAEGKKISGAGFTCEFVGGGTYRIKYTTPFGVRPFVVVSPSFNFFKGDKEFNGPQAVFGIPEDDDSEGFTVHIEGEVLNGSGGTAGFTEEGMKVLFRFIAVEFGTPSGGGEGGAVEGPEGPEGKEGKEGPEGKEGKEGPEGKEGKEGPEGKEGKEGPGSQDWKTSVRAATTANVTIATALNNGDALDGVTLATGDRVLVKNQTTKSQNGIYVVGASPARATDADAAGELSGGTTVYVEEGTRNKRRVFTITTAGSITPGTTSHEWEQLQPKDWGRRESLPTSEAVSGDLCRYLADKTNGIVWSLEYDGEGAYPWKKIGGPPLFAEIATAENQTTESTSFTALATAGPSLTLPLAGDYDIEIGFTGRNNTSGQAAFMSYAVGGTAAKEEDSAVAQSGSAALFPIESASVARKRRKTSLTAASEIVAKYQATSKVGIFNWRWLEIDPIRVG